MKPEIRLYGRKRIFNDDFVQGFVIGCGVMVVVIVLINVVVRWLI